MAYLLHLINQTAVEVTWKQTETTSLRHTLLLQFVPACDLGLNYILYMTAPFESISEF